MRDDLWHLDTLAVHAGRDDLAALGVHAPPIDLSTTNPLPDIDSGGDSYEAMAGGGRPLAEGGMVYARLWNPTVARFEDALAALEHADAAAAFASGMAAMTAVVIAHTVSIGKPHVVAVRPLYGGTDHLLGSAMLGTEVTFCREGEVAASIRPDTGLVVLETPANPTLELVDIAAVVAQAGDVPVVVDNTFATPVLQNPLDLGAAMSLHSATKYLGGHGDVVAGVVAGPSATIAALRRVRAITGGLLHPLGAYLLHRGLPTLPLRMERQQTSAQRIAAWLADDPAVAEVFYPGHDGDPRGLLQRQMRGTGAMVSVRLRGGAAAASALTGAVRLFTHAVSLGGVDSLIQHPAALTHRPVPIEARPGADIVRLSIGLEDAGDLIADLDAALRASAEPSRRASAPSSPGASEGHLVGVSGARAH
ncbi:trans-sulfuration enzyme family protein [Microbacterium flavum]|uniref:PLP-dependent transferase n=1 Tax=Microbacterium flavum TaxID=415216 RepID=A0ABS5XQD3_9MICO|nr:PLP-dependent aspartate aminotransferase family protein [Microbacterium flavum]MBT8796651.1 PLP-dependent transferase [Microbacterium flavum]